MEPKRSAIPPAAFTNLLRVGSNPDEFYLTFAQIAQPASDNAHLVSSLVTTPVCAKSILRALAESIVRYEARFGEIAEPAPAEDADASPAPVKRKKAPTRKRAATG